MFKLKSGTMLKANCDVKRKEILQLLAAGHDVQSVNTSCKLASKMEIQADHRVAMVVMNAKLITKPDIMTGEFIFAAKYSLNDAENISDEEIRKKFEADELDNLIRDLTQRINTIGKVMKCPFLYLPDGLFE